HPLLARIVVARDPPPDLGLTACRSEDFADTLGAVRSKVDEHPLLERRDLELRTLLLRPLHLHVRDLGRLVDRRRRDGLDPRLDAAPVRRLEVDEPHVLVTARSYNSRCKRLHPALPRGDLARRHDRTDGGVPLRL